MRFKVRTGVQLLRLAGGVMWQRESGGGTSFIEWPIRQIYI